MLDIAPPRPDESAAIEHLLDRAFGPGRLAKTSYAYRRGRPPVAGLSFVARDSGRLVGSIAFWPVAIGGAPGLLLGPLAVVPERKGTGIGKALVDHALDRARAQGHRLVVLVGDPDYYARFGFGGAAPFGIAMPNEDPARLQVRALVPGALDGVAGEVRSPEPPARSRVA